MRDKGNYNAFRINQNTTLKPCFLDVHDKKKTPSRSLGRGFTNICFQLHLTLASGFGLTSPAIADRGSLYQLLVAATATDISARNQARGLPYEYPVTGTNR